MQMQMKCLFRGHNKKKKILHSINRNETTTTKFSTNKGERVVLFLDNDFNTTMLQRCIGFVVIGAIQGRKGLLVRSTAQRLYYSETNELFSETDSKANHSPRAPTAAPTSAPTAAAAVAGDCRLFHYTCN